MKRSDPPDLVEVHFVREERSSAAARCFTFEGSPVWIPKSQIEDEDPREDGSIVITLPRWLAEKKGLTDG